MKKMLYRSTFFALVFMCSCAQAAELDYPDLPSIPQIDEALSNHILVRNAANLLKQELANQRKWDSGSYEFNLRVGSAKRNIRNTGEKLNEWDVALERPLRLLNKVSIDQSIGEASVARAEYALGDARHEAARSLLRDRKSVV
jgi:hypothetical protein